MKCDNPGCKNEGHVIQKHGVICHECNDRDIEFMESKQFRRSQDEYENFIKASRERLLEKGLQDAKEGKLVTNPMKPFGLNPEDWREDPNNLSEAAKFAIEFIKEARENKKQRECADNTTLVLSERDWNKVQEVLNNPPKPNDKLLKAFNKFESENPPKATDTKELFAKLKESKLNLTLPTDSAERKNYPLFRGCIKYFTAALAGVARISSIGNEKHNPGEEMYHARGKSSDHGDCIIRHLMDTEDLIAAKARGHEVSDQQILDEASQMAWRSLAYCQELHERFGKAPMASGAK